MACWIPRSAAEFATSSSFSNDVSLNLKWMPCGDAAVLANRNRDDRKIIDEAHQSIEFRFSSDKIIVIVRRILCECSSADTVD